MAQDNPNLISRKAMEAMSSTSGSAYPLISEIFLKVNNAKDKPKKIEVLRQYDKPALRQILKGCFDPKIEWELPEGIPPYIENDVTEGTEHTLLITSQKDFGTLLKAQTLKQINFKKKLC